MKGLQGAGIAHERWANYHECNAEVFWIAGLIMLKTTPTDKTEPASRLATEPRIVLTWLMRMRWLAVGAQLITTAAALWLLKMELPLVPIGTIAAITALTNLLLHWATIASRIPRWVAPAVLLLDIGLLTALLYYTGGSDNPFSTLYLVHVAMAVTVLPSRWTWVIVATAAVSYASLLQYHMPLPPGQQVPEWIAPAGRWGSVVLVSVVIAYFIGRLTRSLRWRDRQIEAFRDRERRHGQLASLTTLAAGAAHELGTPLGTIAVIARELEVACESASGIDPELAEDARLIRSEVDRCRNILNRMRVDILDDSALKSRISVGQLLARLQEEAKPADRLRLETISHQPDVMVPVPAAAIQQALGVLVGNALAATTAGGCVKVVASASEDQLQLEVIDQGSGMTPGVLERAGEPFFTTRPPGQGMGLGLFLVRLVAERYGGTFELISASGQGTRAILGFPLRADPSAD